jgi:hypothetical protein
MPKLTDEHAELLLEFVEAIGVASLTAFVERRGLPTHVEDTDWGDYYEYVRKTARRTLQLIENQEPSHEAAGTEPVGPAS